MADSEQARRLADLEQRVRLLEDALASTRARAAPPTPYRADVPAPPAPPVRAHESMETALGMRWFNRLGALTVLVGLLLGASWASKHGYLGPELRHLLAGLAAIAIFSAGARALGAPEFGRRTVGLGVTIVGAFGMYLVPWAAAHVDHVLPALAAGVLGVAVTVALAQLAWRTGQRAHAFLAAAGGLCVPLLAWTGEGGFTPLWAWVTALCVGALVAARGEGRGRVFAGVGIVLAPVATIYFVALLQARGDGATHAAQLVRGLASAATLLGFAALRADALRAGRVGSRLDGPVATLATLGAAVVAVLVAYLVAARGLAGGALAVLAALEVGLAVRLRPLDEHGRITGAWFALGLLLALAAPVAGGAGRHTLVLAFSTLGAGATLLAVRGGWRKSRALAVLAVWTAAVMIVLPIASTRLRAPEAVEWLVLVGALVASWRAQHRRGDLAPLVYLSAHAAALVLLLRAGTSVDVGAFRLWTTLVPLGYGLVALAAGVARSDAATRAVGLVLLLAAVAKVFVIDVWAASEGVRIAAFLALGAGLLAASFLYGRLADRRQREQA